MIVVGTLFSSVGRASGSAAPVQIISGTETYPLLSDRVASGMLADPNAKAINNNSGLSGLMHIPTDDIQVTANGVIETRSAAQDLIDEIFERLTQNPKFFEFFPYIKNAEPQNLKNTFGVSIAQACKTLKLEGSRCDSSTWVANLFGKKLGIMVVQKNPLDFDSWTNAPYGETMLIVDEAALRAKDRLLLTQSYLHELAIQYDSKSSVLRPLLEAGVEIDLRDMNSLSDLPFVSAMRTARAFRFEAEVMRPEIERYALPAATLELYRPFYSWDEDVCIKTVDQLSRFRGGHGLTRDQRSMLSRHETIEGKKTSICEFVTELDLSGSFLLDGSGPRPRIGAWD